MSSTSGVTDLEMGTVLLTLDFDMLEAAVVSRPNRFVVIAELDGNEVKCHLHDPGRLKELIYPGNRIMIRVKKGEKTDYSVVCARDDGEWVLTDSRFHSLIARNFLPDGVVAEVPVEKRRIDFRSGKELIEVKGCTLVSGGIARFPDAPSIRASEQVKLLARLRREGVPGTVMFLVMRRDAYCFMPNRETDAAFHESINEASKAGVRLLFMKMHLEGNSMVYDGQINMCRDDAFQPWQGNL